jgi:hypothetical protein
MTWLRSAICGRMDSSKYDFPQPDAPVIVMDKCPSGNIGFLCLMPFLCSNGMRLPKSPLAIDILACSEAHALMSLGGAVGALTSDVFGFWTRAIRSSILGNSNCFDFFDIIF